MIVVVNVSDISKIEGTLSKGKGMIKVAVPAAVGPRLHENSSSATLFLVAVFVAAQELVPVRIFRLFCPQCG